MKIKLMAEYFCHPLWHDDGINMGDIDPNDLPISEKLKKQIYHWAEWYNNILNLDNPAISSFDSIDEEQAFLTMGEEIFLQLKVELGNTYDIRYIITV